MTVNTISLTTVTDNPSRVYFADLKNGMRIRFTSEHNANTIRNYLDFFAQHPEFRLDDLLSTNIDKENTDKLRKALVCGIPYNDLTKPLKDKPDIQFMMGCMEYAKRKVAELNEDIEYFKREIESAKEAV